DDLMRGRIGGGVDENARRELWASCGHAAGNRNLNAVGLRISGHLAAALVHPVLNGRYFTLAQAAIFVLRVIKAEDEARAATPVNSDVTVIGRAQVGRQALANRQTEAAQGDDGRYACGNRKHGKS